MIETLFYILAVLCFLDFYLHQLKKHLERKIKRLQPPEKLEPQKVLTFVLLDEDFDLIKREGPFRVEFKRRKSAIDWDRELKKL